MALDIGINIEIKKGGKHTTLFGNGLHPLVKEEVSMTKPHRTIRKKLKGLEGYIYILILVLKILHILILIWKLI